MKKLDKKGFTLVELLAVIVLLAIVGVVGANLILTRLNKGKRDTFINTYNDIKKEITNQVVLGEDPICSTAATCATKYNISSADYNLTVADDGAGNYKITLTGIGTFKNIDLSKATDCTSKTSATSCSLQTIIGTLAK